MAAPQSYAARPADGWRRVPLGRKASRWRPGARGDDPGSVLEIEPDGTVHVVGTKVNMDRPVKKS